MVPFSNQAIRRNAEDSVTHLAQRGCSGCSAFFFRGSGRPHVSSPDFAQALARAETQGRRAMPFPPRAPRLCARDGLGSLPETFCFFCRTGEPQ